MIVIQQMADEILSSMQINRIYENYLASSGEQVKTSQGLSLITEKY